MTFSKFLECRRHWIDLQGDQNYVAEKSFEYTSEADEDRFATQGNLDFISSTTDHFPSYHSECYRKFTDKTKIERAQRSKDSKQTIKSEPMEKKSCTNVNSSKWLKRGEVSKSISVAILPRICLICRKKEIPYTCPVSIILVCILWNVNYCLLHLRTLLDDLEIELFYFLIRNQQITRRQGPFHVCNLWKRLSPIYIQRNVKFKS